MPVLSRFVQSLTLLMVIFVLSACGGGGSSGGGSPHAPQTFTVEGKVSNGPLAGSTVRVFDANGAGLLESTTTDGDGRYSAGVSSGGPYRVRTSGGTVGGVDYTGVLEASCDTGSGCNVTPYTTVLIRLVDEHGFNTGDAASRIAAISDLDVDPFIVGVSAQIFDLDAARQAISLGEGLSTWVDDAVKWATGESEENPPGLGKPDLAPDPDPGTTPDPDPGPTPDPDPVPDPETYAVTTTAGAGGDISPANQTVAHGATTTFTVSPDAGYSIDTVVGCGGSLDGNTYTTRAITGACTVEASFLLDAYTVSATAGPGGDISPASQTVDHGAKTIFIVTPDTGYAIDSVSGCGGSLSANAYTTGTITYACKISVQFTLDPAFSVNSGKLTMRIGTSSGIVSLALQPDGKIVAAGTATDEERGLRSDVALARYNHDGTLDESFGNAGIVKTNIHRIRPSTDWVTDMKIQGDGKIVVAGYTAEHGDPRLNLYLARYLPDGRLDTSFSDTGISITTQGVDTRIRNIVLLDDGGILAAGGDPWGGYFLARYNTDGSIDPSFGANGFVWHNLMEFARRVAVTSDGKILVSGVSRFSGDEFASYIVLAQHLEDGSIDRNFGASGRVETVISWDVGSGSSVTDMLLQPDGKIVLGGNARVGYGHNELLVVRYNSDGGLDSGFGNSGYVIKGFDTANRETSVALQPDGSLVATNRTNFPLDGEHPYPEVYSSTARDFAIVRYAVDGELDGSFGNSGMKTVDFRKMRDTPRAILVQPDGKVVVGGSSTTHVPGGGDYRSFAIVRLNDEGSLDASFNP